MYLTSGCGDLMSRVSVQGLGLYQPRGGAFTRVQEASYYHRRYSLPDHACMVFRVFFSSVKEPTEVLAASRPGP